MKEVVCNRIIEVRMTYFAFQDAADFRRLQTHTFYAVTAAGVKAISRRPARRLTETLKRMSNQTGSIAK